MSIGFGSSSYDDQSFTISTGSAFIYLTETMVKALQGELSADWTCDSYGCQSTKVCSELSADMPTMKFDIRGADGASVKIELPGQAYTWDYQVGN